MYKNYKRCYNKNIVFRNKEENMLENLEGNNMSGKIAFLRDTFLEAEKSYLLELVKQPKYKK